MKILLICLFFCAGIMPPASAQIFSQDVNPLKAPAFEHGERLVYYVNYRIGFINVDVAMVTFSIYDSYKKNQEVFHIKAVGEVRPRYTNFFNLYDVYNTYLDKTNLRPVYFSNDLREDSYRFRSSYDYDWEKMEVTTTARNLKWDVDKVVSFPLSNVSYDAVSLFFNLRSVSLNGLREGEYYNLEVVFADKVRKVQYCFLGRESKEVKGLGIVKCLKFKCQLANASGESFKDGSEFTMWISDDKNRIPVYVDSPIRVGSVRVRLTEFSGLKYVGVVAIESK